MKTMPSCVYSLDTVLKVRNQIGLLELHIKLSRGESSLCTVTDSNECHSVAKGLQKKICPVLTVQHLWTGRV